MPEHWISRYERREDTTEAILEDAYRTFYHTVFHDVSRSYGIISNGLKIKKSCLY